MNEQLWMDVTIPVVDGMVSWPKDPTFQSERVVDMGRGDVCNLTKMSLSVHTGTHMDAPLHFVRDGVPMGAMPIDAVVGPARVIAIDDPVAIRAEHLVPHDLRAGERVLFRTLNSERQWHTRSFDEDFVHISADAARYLVERKVRTVGIDYLSIGGFKTDGVLCHQIILGAGMWVIEGLNLCDVEPGEYDLVCLPLKVVNAEGSPARVILRRRVT